MSEGLPVIETPPDVDSDVFHSGCPGRVVMEHITGRWATPIVVALRGGPLRFFELRERIDGVSEKMLSQKLRVLVRDGLLERRVQPTIPPQVSYELTELGRSLSRPLHQLVNWIRAHAGDVVDAQHSHDHASS